VTDYDADMICVILMGIVLVTEAVLAFLNATRKEKRQ